MRSGGQGFDHQQPLGWLIGIAFFLLVLAAGALIKVTGYGEPTTTVASTPATGTVAGASSTPGDTPGVSTGTTGEQVAVDAAVSADDLLVLAQTELPPVARVDYAAFPTGDDPHSASGRTFHVAPTGDDGGPGSETQPFATIERALSVAADGEAVLIHEGVYSSGGLVVTQSRFLLSAAPGEEVTVEAEGLDAGYGLSVSVAGQHDVTVRGLRLTGFARLGVHYGNPVTIRGLVFEDLVVEGAAEGMAGYYDAADTIVEGMLVRRVSLLDIGSIGFQFGAGGGRNVRISGLHVRMAGAGAGDTASDGLAFESGENVLIESSIVEGAAGDGIDLKASKVAVVNSIVRHVGRNGIKMWAGGDVLNSLVYDTGADAQVVTEGGVYRIVNSTFAYHNRDGTRSYAATFGYDSPGSTLDVTILNCVFYAQPGPLYFSPGARVRVENTVFWGFPDRLVGWGDRNFGLGNEVVEPAFVDPLQGDFHPGVGSPLFSAGALGPEVPSFDLLLVPRVESITAGAFQTTRTGTAPTTTTSTTAPDSTTTSTVPPPAPSFADVVSSDPYAEAILGLAARGVVHGYPQPGGSAQFRPDDPVRRAQFAKLIVVTLGLTVSEGLTAPFDDLGPDDPVGLYPHEYVAAAAANGITVGVGGRRFDPYGEVSRAQVLTMAVRAARARAPGALLDPPTEYRGSLGSFDPIHGEAARVAEYNGLVVGFQGFGISWEPYAPATRGEAAWILWQLDRRLKEGS